MLPLSPIYKTASSNNLPCVINYVWVDKVELRDLKKPPLCGIPLHYVDRALENVRKYPEAEFQIWVDPNFWEGTPTWSILQSHLNASGCQNITVRDLNEIEAYSNDPFYKRSQTNVWHRADMARLLVTRQSVLEHPDKVSVYTDFDTSDILLNDESFNASLEKFGFVVGSPTLDEEMKKKGDYVFENGYFAFRNHAGSKQLLSDIITDAQTKLEHGIDRSDSLVYSSYRRSIEAYLEREKPGPISECIMKVGWAMGYCIPVNLKYTDICGPAAAYL